MYQRKSSMSTRQLYRLIEHFEAGTTARSASQIIGIQATTSARFFIRLRKLSASKLPSYELYGQVEADKRYFDGDRNFWNQTKRHRRRFNGIKRTNFYWFLKECACIFNGGDHLQLLTEMTSWYTHTKTLTLSYYSPKTNIRYYFFKVRLKP